MRKSNQQKWDESFELLKMKKSLHIDIILGEVKPLHYYKATVKGVELFNVSSITVRLKSEPYKDKRITNQMLKDLYSCIDNFEDLEKEIHLHYKEARDGWSTMGAYKYSCFDKDSHIENPSNVFFDKEKAILKHEYLKERYAEKDGHSPCAYCRVQTPIDKLVSGTVIFQNSNASGRRFVDRKTQKYCSGKCAGYDQMAHEG